MNTLTWNPHLKTQIERQSVRVRALKESLRIELEELERLQAKHDDLLAKQRAAKSKAGSSIVAEASAVMG